MRRTKFGNSVYSYFVRVLIVGFYIGIALASIGCSQIAHQETYVKDDELPEERPDENDIIIEDKTTVVGQLMCTGITVEAGGVLVLADSSCVDIRPKRMTNRSAGLRIEAGARVIVAGGAELDMGGASIESNGVIEFAGSEEKRATLRSCKGIFGLGSIYARMTLFHMESGAIGSSAGRIAFDVLGDLELIKSDIRFESTFTAQIGLVQANRIVMRECSVYGLVYEHDASGSVGFGWVIGEKSAIVDECKFVNLLIGRAIVRGCFPVTYVNCRFESCMFAKEFYCEFDSTVYHTSFRSVYYRCTIEQKYGAYVECVFRECRLNISSVGNRMDSPTIERCVFEKGSVTITENHDDQDQYKSTLMVSDSVFFQCFINVVSKPAWRRCLVVYNEEMWFIDSHMANEAESWVYVQCAIDSYFIALESLGMVSKTLEMEKRKEYIRRLKRVACASEIRHE